MRERERERGGMDAFNLVYIIYVRGKKFPYPLGEIALSAKRELVYKLFSASSGIIPSPVNVKHILRMTTRVSCI